MEGIRSVWWWEDQNHTETRSTSEAGGLLNPERSTLHGWSKPVSQQSGRRGQSELALIRAQGKYVKEKKSTQRMTMLPKQNKAREGQARLIFKIFVR